MKTPNPKNIGLAWVLHMVDHFVAAVYERGPVRALDFGFRIKKIWSLDFGDNKTAIFGTLQPFFWKLSVSLYPSRPFFGGVQNLLLVFFRQKIIFHIYDVPPEYLQINGGKAGDFSRTFFFVAKQLQIPWISVVFDSCCGVFFFKNGEVPMDADVEFEFGGVYRLGPKCCCMKWPMTLLWRLGGVKPSFHQG